MQIRILVCESGFGFSDRLLHQLPAQVLTQSSLTLPRLHVHTHGARKQRLLNTRADQVPYCRALPWSDGPPSSKGVAQLPAQDGGGGEPGAGGGDVHLPPGVLVDLCLPVLCLPWPLPKSTSSLEVRPSSQYCKITPFKNASLSTHWLWSTKRNLYSL